ncbi:dubious [Schizosaccharomyces pombe]|uniref:Putative uncharacterized protein C338.03c n=1 Tax=Schizosaccharomyces pombe (strain 972 / ATCC 24843) TaxID=284812 RepID=YJZ3_SCHPO|nr:uncharacterized protein SPCC338.03c [Schizosaccharomyces pombe]A6X993.1 RecName: Full=Putative uncharacterized protein C338.03c [Schizosaccharomyces pombe 972h-]CAO77689.1 dubious [Schizosaccharomyces pombe]|eukprot:NP_001343057.1 uncharacterized protein SPCC338.03c [Schizosaccharomyces pombe]
MVISSVFSAFADIPSVYLISVNCGARELWLTITSIHFVSLREQRYEFLANSLGERTSSLKSQEEMVSVSRNGKQLLSEASFFRLGKHVHLNFLPFENTFEMALRNDFQIFCTSILFTCYIQSFSLLISNFFIAIEVSRSFF